MSVNEWEQAETAHHERRMPIMNEVHDKITQVTERQIIICG